MSFETAISYALAVFFVAMLGYAVILSVKTAKTLRSTYRTMTGTALTLARNWDRLGRPDEAERQRREAQDHARRAIGWQPGRKAKVAALLAEKEPSA